jgi:heme-degrading monooxygenase HmoA
MIVYVVDLEVDEAIASGYLLWLRAHVREMLELPGFEGAQIFERLEPSLTTDGKAYSVHYRLRDREAFEAYLREHAPRMRSAGARFGAQVHATRGLLKPLQ